MCIEAWECSPGLTMHQKLSGNNTQQILRDLKTPITQEYVGSIAASVTQFFGSYLEALEKEYNKIFSCSVIRLAAGARTVVRAVRCLSCVHYPRPDRGSIAWHPIGSPKTGCRDQTGSTVGRALILHISDPGSNPSPTYGSQHRQICSLSIVLRMISEHQ